MACILMLAAVVRKDGLRKVTMWRDPASFIAPLL